MKYFLAVFTTAVLVFVGATIYYKGLPSFPSFTKNSVSTQSGIPVVSNEVAPEVSEPQLIKSAMQDAFINKYGTEAASLNITVSEINGDFAKGMVNDKGGGGLWFAAKSGENWLLVWDGNGIIQCSDLKNYPNYPSTMIPECYDTASQKLIER